MRMKCALSLSVFLSSRLPVGKVFLNTSGDVLPLGACGAKLPTQQNEHLVFLNTSGDVLVKMLEKVRAHFTHTGSGRGPTLLGHKIEESFILK